MTDKPSVADLQRIKALFLEAIDLAPERREAWLEQRQDLSAALRAQLRVQLQMYESTPPDLAAPQALEHETRRATDSPLADPESLGPYRVLRRIGEGGMGIVYACEQLEPVRRHVAVKRLKAGMDSEAIARRFEAERQALARMSHPCIAQVFDAGVDEGGRHWFAMELVEGESITAYADRKKLSIEARLRLFLELCRGVEHAHRRGVIHRDLKPGNTLVQEVDDRAQPKVIDFGIAKAIGESLGSESLHTRVGAVLGTPEYMSPEQASLHTADLDVRTDVYSLGVVLYELLTGELPGATPAEVVRPSARFRTSEKEGVLRAAARASDPRALVRLLRNDLEWIVLRALHFEREGRYDSVRSFSQDVERYLAHEPVAAGPPSKIYRLRRGFRRHRVAVLSLLAIGISLVAGAGFALRSAWDAERARSQADRARLEAEASLFEVYDTLSRSLAHAGLRDQSSPDVARLRALQGQLLSRALPEFESFRESTANWRFNHPGAEPRIYEYLKGHLEELPPELRLVASDILSENVRTGLPGNGFAESLEPARAAVQIRDAELESDDPRTLLARLLLLDCLLSKQEKPGQEDVEEVEEILASTRRWRPPPREDRSLLVDARFAARLGAALVSRERLLREVDSPLRPEARKHLADAEEELTFANRILWRYEPSCRGVRVANAALVELYELREQRGELATQALERLRHARARAGSDFEFGRAALGYGAGRQRLIDAILEVQDITTLPRRSTPAERLEAVQNLERVLDEQGISEEDARSGVIAGPLASYSIKFRNLSEHHDEALDRLSRLAYRLAAAHRGENPMAFVQIADDRAMILRDLGRFEEAAEMARECVSIPFEAITPEWFWLSLETWGTCLGRLGRFEEGFDACWRAWRGFSSLNGRNANDSVTILRRAAQLWAAWSRSDPGRAGRALASIKSGLSSGDRLYFDAAFLAIAAERYDREEVRARAQRILDAGDANRTQLTEVARAFVRIGAPDRARACLELALEDAAQIGDWSLHKVQVWLGEVSYAYGDLDRAEEEIEAAAPLDPLQWYPRRRLAAIAMEQDRFDLAKGLAEGDQLLQARILFREGRDAEALLRYEEADPLGAVLAPCREFLPALVKLGREGEARERCERLLADNFRGVDTWCFVSRFLATCEGLDEADRERGLELARRAQSYVGAGVSARVEATLAEAEIGAGRRAEGIARLEAVHRALEERPAAYLQSKDVAERLEELRR